MLFFISPSNPYLQEGLVYRGWCELAVSQLSSVKSLWVFGLCGPPVVSVLGFSFFFITFVVVQSLSRVLLAVTSWTAARQAPLSFTVSRSSLKLMSIKAVVPSNHLILCRPLLRLSVFPSIGVFSSEPVLCIGWPKYWTFGISPSSEYSGFISFRSDWFS